MGESDPGPRGKVVRLIEEYELGELGEYLVERWTADDAEERLSLRALAREFNIRLLETKLAKVSAESIEGTAESYYESLVGGDVSSGVQTQVRRSLEQAGVDVDELEAEFVSRQAVHTYLTKTRGVSQSHTEGSISSSSVQGTIDRLQERVRIVTTSRLERLRDVGELTIGEFRVIVDVQIYCVDCNNQQGISKLLESGACECQG